MRKGKIANTRARVVFYKGSGMQLAGKQWLVCTMTGRMVILTVVMLTCYAVGSVLAWWLHGGAILGIVAWSAGICYVSTIVAMVGEYRFSKRNLALIGILWAMAFRTGIPLAAVLILLIRAGHAVEPWMICYIGAFYFIALTVHVALSFCSMGRVPASTASEILGNKP